jgi:hypothetical protein
MFFFLWTCSFSSCLFMVYLIASRIRRGDLDLDFDAPIVMKILGKEKKKLIYE